MKTFNITAQVYDSLDKNKQTILLNKEVIAESRDHAIDRFTNYFIVPHYTLVKIYSVEEFSSVVS